jgi:hypothetical protein
LCWIDKTRNAGRLEGGEKEAFRMIKKKKKERSELMMLGTAEYYSVIKSTKHGVEDLQECREHYNVL